MVWGGCTPPLVQQLNRTGFGSKTWRFTKFELHWTSLEHKSPFIPQDANYTEFSSELVMELEGGTKKADGILEEECRDLFSMVAIRVAGHLLLHDPCFDLEEVMGPMPKESRDDFETAMEGHVNTPPGKFFYSDGKEPDEESRVLVLK
ncbi:hypothetical protein D1007_46689 [Hordeum vulgare]|nr:hypothetical protein D1007_46689 [Hordeum vulgare]